MKYVVTCGLLLAGCGGGGRGGGGPGTGPLGANVPVQIQVDAPSISFRLSEPKLVSAAAVEPVQIQATGFGGELYVLGVPLLPGANTIRIRGQRADGSEVEGLFGVQNSPNPRTVVELTSSPLVSAVGTPFALAAHSTEPAIASVLWDLDGDGTIDIESGGLSLQHAFATPGSYAPSCTIETSSGLLFTSLPDPARNLIATLPDEGVAVIDSWLSGLAGLGEVHAHPGADELFVLSPDDARVYRLGGSGTLIQTIDLPGLLAPQGFGCADNGDLYVADTGNGRVVRLSASTGYGLDPGFAGSGSLGSQGAAVGKLDAPQDVALMRDPERDELLVCVADMGNARLQTFNEAGSVRFVVLGDELGGNRLQEPIRLAPAGPYAVGVLDRAGASLRFYDHAGKERGQGSPVGGPAWQAPAAMASELVGGGWAVLDSGSIRILGPDLGWIRSFDPGFGVTGLCFQRSGESSRLVLASDDSSVSGLSVVTLAQDPPGFDPLDVVRDFAAAIGAADLALTLALCEGEMSGSVLAIFADPASLSELQALLGGMGALQLVDQRGDLAQLVSTTTHAGGLVELEWLLERSKQDRRWRVLSL